MVALAPSHAQIVMAEDGMLTTLETVLLRAALVRDAADSGLLMMMDGMMARVKFLAPPVMALAA